MLKKTIVIIIILIAFINKGYSQELKKLQEINKVWVKFSEAFDALDYQLFAKINSTKLIRIGGGKRITDYDSYIKNTKLNFEEAKKYNSTQSIYFRFIERVSNDSIASERGIFKYVVNKNQSNEKTSYGKFHVILIKENSDWKIFMDYDSNYGTPTNEENYNKAVDMNEFEKFIKH